MNLRLEMNPVLQNPHDCLAPARAILSAGLDFVAELLPDPAARPPEIPL